MYTTFKTLILELNLDESAIWNPQFSLRQLIGQRKKPNKPPPRPPNSFFLFKNSLLLNAHERGQRLTMTHLSKLASKIWEHCPQELRAIYDRLGQEAQNLHSKDFPGYSYKPGKRQLFKPYDPGNSVASKRQRGRRAVNLIDQTTTDQTGQVLVEDAQHPHDKTTQINPYYESIMNMYLRLEDEAQLKSML
ncbi:39773_t:CDS:2 [Gigaspora margarita]|uniref:39773_t:CDS:1 n=1 Tax=Gigaspora margarita TaxID=4874 RepID=A0ABN7VCG9_GIGMA|nr:39773_t:CDS:2 [Gigaspora margarita]